MDGKQKHPEIVTYNIPRIEVYQVTEDELCRIEEGSGKVNQDFAWWTNFLSWGVAFFIALLTGNFSGTARDTLTMVVIGCGIGTLITGVRWLKCRKTAPDVIAKIRSRKTEPQA